MFNFSTSILHLSLQAITAAFVIQNAFAYPLSSNVITVKNGESELRQKTNLKSIKTSEQIKLAVINFEAQGGKGIWISSKSIWVRNGLTAHFYVVQKWPLKPNPQSPFHLARLDHSLRFAKSLTNAGALLLLSEISLDSRAAAITESAESTLAKDVQKKATNSVSGSVVLITLDTMSPTLAHENQHINDFDSPEFNNKLESILKPLEERKILSDEEVAELNYVIIELRGHARQEIQLRDNLLQRLPIIDRSKNVLTFNHQDYEGFYKFQIAQAVNVFKHEHAKYLRYYLAKVKESDPNLFKKTVEGLSSLDFSSELKTSDLTILNLLKPLLLQ